MAGIFAKLDDRVLQKKLARLRAGVSDASPLMKIWGEIGLASIQENFEVGGRPKKWTKLAASTIERKGHNRPLIGRTGNLSRLTMKADRDGVTLGTSPSSKAYAARQQFGWPGTGARAGGKVKTPARPFLLLQDEDVREMGDESTAFFRRLGS